MLLSNENTMYDLGLSEIFIIAFVVVVFGLGIYTLRKFLKNKNF